MTRESLMQETGIVARICGVTLIVHKQNTATRIWNNLDITTNTDNETAWTLTTPNQLNVLCEISGSHGGEYDVQSLLGCSAV
jgi:hypothetical protein